MAKKITAPKTYDPGKGRPKEHLAYLNEREMAYLRSINGNNMERGPKGLPSFPPKDAVGSSSKASPSRGPGGPSGPNSSPSGSRGIGGGGKGGTTGGRGPGGPSGPNSAASGSRGVGGGTKGPGGPSGPNSGPSVSRGPSQAKTPSAGGYKGPASPMSGQGTSFKSPSTYSDRSIQQKVQTASTQKAVRGVPAVRGDLSSGGIRTLNVGPMGTPVKVGGAKPSKSQGPLGAGWDERIPSAAAPAPSISKQETERMRDQYGFYKNPDAPMAPMVGDKLRDYLKAQDQFEREMRELGQLDAGPQRTVTRTGSPIMAGGARTPVGSQPAGFSAPPSPAGFMSAERQLLDRENTLYSPKDLGSLYKDIGSYNISDLEKRTLAQQQLLGQTISASKYGGRVTAVPSRGLSSPGQVDPFTGGVVTHWTAGSPKPDSIEKLPYNVVINAAGDINYQTGFTPEGAMIGRYHTFGRNPVTGKPYSSGNIGISSTGIEPNPAQLSAARSLGENWFNPDAPVTTHGYEAGVLGQVRKKADPFFKSKNIRMEAEGARLAGAFSGKPVADKYFSPTKLAGLSPDARKDVGSAVPEVKTPSSSGIISPAYAADAPTGPLMSGNARPQVSLVGGAVNAVTDALKNPKEYQVSIPEASAFVKAMPDKLKQAAIYAEAKKFGEDLPGRVSSGIEAIQSYTRPMVQTATAPKVSPSAEDAYGPKYVSPEVQEEMAKIDKMNRRGTRVMKAATGPIGRAADAVRGLITGKNTAEADADLKRAYMQGNATQRAELERRNPNLTKFAQQAGIEPQLPMSNYENWRQRSFGTGGAGGVSTTVVGSGGTPDFGSGGKFQYRPGPGSAPYSPPPTTTEKAERGRPQQYYNWDAGVGIPSPGDSDYTLYLKYLEEKAAARAAV